MSNKPISIDKFRRLFVHRNDVYALQTISGAYSSIKKPITDAIIEDHFNGKVSVGLYQLLDETVKWACIDIDVNKEVWSAPDFKMEDWDERMDQQASQIKDIFAKNGLTSYIENSGFKGRHVWIFFQEAITSTVARNVLRKLFNKLKLVDTGMHIEIFPKQTTAEFGNLVKAPFAKHKKSGNFSTFLDDISDIDYVSSDKMKAIIDPFDTIFEGCAALNDIKENGVRAGYSGHESRLALSYIFGNLGEEGVDYITNNFYAHMDNFDEDVTRENLGHVSTKGYKPISCTKLQEQGLCPGPCQNIGNGKSPIVYWYRAQGFDYKDDQVELYDPLDDYAMQGRCYYLKTPRKGAPPMKISNFIVDIKEHLYIDDGLDQTTFYKADILTEEGSTIPFEINAKDFSSNEKLSAALYEAVGNNGILLENVGKIRQAINKFTKAEITKIRRIFGYNETFTKYYSPSTVITAEGLKENDESVVDLVGLDKAENLDIIQIHDEQFKKLKKHISDDLLGLTHFEVTSSAIAATMLPIIVPFTGKIQNRPIYFLRGSTGKGKSFLLLAMQNFFGRFTEPVSWTSTPNSIQKIGYYFKDAMYLVDDYKRANLGMNNQAQARAILQNYADMTGRSRLKSDSSLQKTYSIKGGLTISGEDIVSGEASNLARMIIIEYPQTKPDLKKGYRVEDLAPSYSAFTGRYINYILKQDKEDMRKMVQDYTAKFFESVQGEHNSIRIARNMGLMITSYTYLANFLWNKKVAKDNIATMTSFYITIIEQMLNTISEEQITDKFWYYLQEFISTGKVCLKIEAADAPKGVPVVGHLKMGKTYLLPKASYLEIQAILRRAGMELGCSKSAIFKDLATEGRIDSHKGKQMNFGSGVYARAVEAFFDKETSISSQDTEFTNKTHTPETITWK